jgi:hypothetical protein
VACYVEASVGTRCRLLAINAMGTGLDLHPNAPVVPIPARTGHSLSSLTLTVFDSSNSLLCYTAQQAATTGYLGCHVLSTANQGFSLPQPSPLVVQEGVHTEAHASGRCRGC